jgi:hypothetical protein
MPKNRRRKYHAWAPLSPPPPTPALSLTIHASTPTHYPHLYSHSLFIHLFLHTIHTCITTHYPHLLYIPTHYLQYTSISSHYPHIYCHSLSTHLLPLSTHTYNSVHSPHIYSHSLSTHLLPLSMATHLLSLGNHTSIHIHLFPFPLHTATLTQ